MDEPFLGTISAFAFPQAPRGWAVCDGRPLPIQKFSALFSLLGTTYGGDGTSTFALPDLSGRQIVGTDGSQSGFGQQVGSSAVLLRLSQLPEHSHAVYATSTQAKSDTPIENAYAPTRDGGANAELKCYGSDSGAAMLPTLPKGNSQLLDIQNPFLGLNYCIAIQGIFPTRAH